MYICVVRQYAWEFLYIFMGKWVIDSHKSPRFKFLESYEYVADEYRDNIDINHVSFIALAIRTFYFNSHDMKAWKATALHNLDKKDWVGTYRTNYLHKMHVPS